MIGTYLSLVDALMMGSLDPYYFEPFETLDTFGSIPEKGSGITLDSLDGKYRFL